jgi:hypothetical protein
VGHTKVRCKAPPADVDGDGLNGYGGGVDSGEQNFDAPAPVVSVDDDGMAW